MKLELKFEGNGRKILIGVAALVVAAVGVMWWQSGADQRNDKRNLEQSLAQAQRAAQIRDQEARDAIFSPGSRYIYPHEQIIYDMLRGEAMPLINDAENFQEEPGWGPHTKIFHQVARSSLLSLELKAGDELKRLVKGKDISDQQKMEIGEGLGRKYTALFKEWFAPRWAKVQAAGPGKASWDLKFETID